MTWSALFVAFVVCHLAGDLLLQTEWQAVTKVRGLGDPEARRALIFHATTYTLAFIPALIWVGNNTTTWTAIGVAFLIGVPHVLVDDGHFTRAWLRVVKHAPNPAFSLQLMVDQSFHIVCLLGAALLAASGAR